MFRLTDYDSLCEISIATIADDNRVIWSALAAPLKISEMIIKNKNLIII